MLRGDGQCPNLVATSVYDTKPVHFLSMSAESIKWIKKKRDVYDKVKKGIVNAEFLRLNINDDYNSQMGHVDVADQLRNYYRMDHWMRKTKWWWSYFFWGVGVLIVNAYVAYKTFMKNKGLAYMSQYEFRRKICLAYIAPQQFWLKRKRVRSGRGRSRRLADTYKVSDVQIVSPRKRKKISVVTTRSTSSRERATRVNDKTLAPDGALKCRLGNHGEHWPIMQTSACAQCCALHRWFTGGRKYYHYVVQCSLCKINLCVKCFSDFHNIRNIVDKKGAYEQQYNKTK